MRIDSYWLNRILLPFVLTGQEENALKDSDIIRINGILEEMSRLSLEYRKIVKKVVKSI